MGVNSLPKTVTRQRRGCDLNPGPSAPESSTLTTRLPSHHENLADRNKSTQRMHNPASQRRDLLHTDSLQTLQQTRSLSSQRHMFLCKQVQ